MRILLLILLPLTAIAAAVYGFHAASVAAEQASDLRNEVTSLQAQVARTTHERDRAREEAVSAGRRAAGYVENIRYLEAEILAEQNRRREVDAFLEKTEQILRNERARHNREIFEAREYMPEGVRQALLTINELMRLDGQDNLRFMKAKKIEDYTLHGVQLIDHDPKSLRSSLYMVGRMSLKLDRKTGRLAFTMKDGFFRSASERREFPEAGESLVLTDVDGRAWEERLPFLVQGEGEYPRAERKARPVVMESTIRVGWQRRLNKLFDLAKTKMRYKIEKFRNLVGGRFEDALVLGSKRGRVLAMSVEAEAMSVVIDERAGTVELLVHAGILRRVGGESEVPESGYRIQLKGIAPKQAIDVLQGMVIRK